MNLPQHRVEKPPDEQVRAELELITPTQRERLLDYFRENRGCSHKQAAMHAGMMRRHVKALLAFDEEFREDYAHALGVSPEKLVAQAVKRAYDDDKPSDRLLDSLLRAYVPAFQDVKRLELTGAGGGPVRVEHSGTDVAELRKILMDAGAFEEAVDGDAVEDAEVVRSLPGPDDLLPARPASEPETGGLPPLPEP